MHGKAILLTGDLPERGPSIGWALESWGCEVDFGLSLKSARRAFLRNNYDLLICCTTRAHRAWLEIIREAAGLRPETRIMLLSAGHQEAWPLEAYEMGIDDYVDMEAGPEALCRRVTRCLRTPKETAAWSSRIAPLELLNQSDSRLMAIFHDLRSAMVGISATIKLLSRGKYGELPEDALEKINEAHGRMHKLIDLSEDFINQVLAGGSGEEIKIEDEILDLRQDVVEPILSECAAELRDQQIIIDNRLILFRAQAPPLKGSRAWLRSVFRNLLNNAIRHGGRGCTITIELKGQNGAHYLHVCNTGRPIAPARRDMLFTRFSQPDRRCRSGSRGLKLGLSLSQEIMRQLGGDLWYEPWGQGSDFVVMLPPQ